MKRPIDGENYWILIGKHWYICRWNSWSNKFIEFCSTESEHDLESVKKYILIENPNYHKL